jgi:hypothetical protein
MTKGERRKEKIAWNSYNKKQHTRKQRKEKITTFIITMSLFEI